MWKLLACLQGLLIRDTPDWIGIWLLRREENWKNTNSLRKTLRAWCQICHYLFQSLGNNACFFPFGNSLHNSQNILARYKSNDYLSGTVTLLLKRTGGKKPSFWAIFTRFGRVDDLQVWALESLVQAWDFLSPVLSERLFATLKCYQVHFSRILAVFYCILKKVMTHWNISIIVPWIRVDKTNYAILWTVIFIWRIVLSILQTNN